MKMACGDRRRRSASRILDPEVTVSQPRAVTAVTGIDALAHAVESYVCTQAQRRCRRRCRSAAWRHLEPNFETVLRDPANLDARAAMQVGSHFAGAAIENSMLGACHACANPLTAHYGITHGIAIGVLLPHVDPLQRPGGRGACTPNCVAASRPLNGEPGGRGAGPPDRRRCWRAAGLPTRLRDCGVSESILPLLAEEASEQWTARFNPRPVTEADLHAI